MRQHKPSGLRPGWVRLALIEGAVIALGALTLVALGAIDERTRALLPFIPH